MKLATIALLALSLCACKRLSSEPGVRQARALSPESLAEIYRDMEQLRRDSPKGRAIFNGPSPRLPASIRALEPITVNVGNLDRIVLSGGFDDKAELVLNGLSRPGEKQIYLYGGDEVRELLWEETNTATE